MPKSKDKERPGVIVYFDTLRALERVSMAARGYYLTACLEYGRELTIPDFSGLETEDRIRLETLWDTTQPRIDADAQGWKDGILQRRYAGYASGCQRKGETPMDYNAYRDWAERMDDTDTPILDSTY